MATTYLTRTFSSPTNRNIFTWSAWVKRQNQVSNFANALFGAYLNSNVRTVFRFNGHKLNFQDTEGSVEILTNRLFRDVNGWYHIVLAVDTTQATASNRVKLYVNGVQETSFSTANYPAQNSNLLMGGADIHYINARNSSGSVESIADMSYSHIHFTDGTAYDPSAFGQYDANGVWTIKTSPSVTYGNNGFFILKDGNSVTDQSGNSNNWTVVGGTLTKTEDNPSNVFATFNRLIKTPSGLSYSHGNTTLTTTNTQWEGSATTLGATSGKWYWEAKYNTGSGIRLDIGRLPSDMRFMDNSNQSYLSYSTYGYGYQLNNTGYDYYGSNNSFTTWTTNRGNSTKIYMVAVDLDNGKMWIGADGSWFNKSGTANPVTGDDPLHDFSADLNGDPWLFGMSVEGSGGSHNANFGNGYFGTTAVASAGTNASGNGIFEYDVPTGYTAFCTKGLNGE